MKEDKMKIDIENTRIAADMLSIYQDLKDSNPKLASEALKVHDAYWSKAKEK